MLHRRSVRRRLTDASAIFLLALLVGGWQEGCSDQTDRTRIPDWRRGDTLGINPPRPPVRPDDGTSCTVGVGGEGQLYRIDPSRTRVRRGTHVLWDGKVDWVLKSGRYNLSAHEERRVRVSGCFFDTGNPEVHGLHVHEMWLLP